MITTKSRGGGGGHLKHRKQLVEFDALPSTLLLTECRLIGTSALSHRYLVVIVFWVSEYCLVTLTTREISP